MTPQFTTPCYVQVDDPKKRKEVCEKLIDLGYEMDELTRKHLDVIPEFFQVSTGTKKRQIFVTSELGAIHKVVGRIDCSSNIDLFLALASMRSDTDMGQWFICEESYTDPMLDYQFVEAGTLVKQGEFDQYAKAFYRCATAQEIFEYFKTKEK